MDSKLHLVTVDSPEEEEAVLHALSEWPSVPASHLVPLRRSDHGGRLVIRPCSSDHVPVDVCWKRNDIGAHLRLP